MSLIEKLLELIPIKKEQWIPILVSIIMAGTIGGFFYILSLHNRIAELERANAEQREIDKGIIEYLEKRVQTKETEIQKAEEHVRAKIEAEYFKREAETFRQIFISQQKNK